MNTFLRDHKNAKNIKSFLWSQLGATSKQKVALLAEH